MLNIYLFNVLFIYSFKNIFFKSNNKFDPYQNEPLLYVENIEVRHTIELDKQLLFGQYAIELRNRLVLFLIYFYIYFYGTSHLIL